MTSPGPLLEARGITRRFPGVEALRDVDLRLHRGEVLAVIGENGAGKSTLMKILAGVLPPHGGEIVLDGRPTAIASPRHATELGIALIHQELNLLPNLSVGANIFLGREPHRAGWLDRPRIHAEAGRVLKRIGVEISPRTRVGRLAPGQRQLVEIARALSTEARILIMDEPTSSLTRREARALFDVIRDLRARGAGVIYISHRLAEVEALADRVLVLRDGRNAGELAREEATHDAMVRLMVGRDLSRFYARTPHAAGETVLEARGLVTPGRPRHRLDFSVRSGEIVGLAGLVGAGRTELLRALFGIDRALGGEVRVAGRAVPPGDPAAAIRAGMALVPEDRKTQGLVLDMTVRRNLSLAGLRRYRRAGGRIDRRSEARDSAATIDRLAIRTPTDGQVVRFLSGGNQQKVVLGKWLGVEPRVLLLDEPTRGIDVGAKQEIYSMMERLARDGLAVLFASSELEEILGMADRVLVLHEGRLTGALPRAAMTEEAVMRLATGRADTPEPLS